METPNERMKRLRLDLKMTGEAFGKLMDITSSLVYWYENGGGNKKRFLDDYKLGKLIEKTGVRREWLLKGEKPQFDESHQKEITISTQQSEPALKQRRIELTIGKGEELHIILRHS